MDEAVGAVVRALKDSGMLKNTVIGLLDNGDPTDQGADKDTDSSIYFWNFR